MININITSQVATFYSNVSQADITANLFEPKWERNDDSSFSLYTEQGIFNITVADYTLNGNKYKSSDAAISYLISL
jgi:hypothetical protein